MNVLNTIKSAFAPAVDSRRDSILSGLYEALSAWRGDPDCELIISAFHKQVDDFLARTVPPSSREHFAPLWQTAKHDRAAVFGYLLIAERSGFHKAAPQDPPAFSPNTFRLMLAHDAQFILRRLSESAGPLPDWVASELVNAISDRQWACTPQFLSLVLDCASNRESVRTRARLKQLLADDLWVKRHDKLAKMARTRVPDLLAPALEVAQPAKKFPEIKWLTLNKIERLRAYIENAGGQIFDASHVKAAENLVARARYDDRAERGKRLKFLTDEVQRLGSAQKLSDLSLVEEYEDLQDYRWSYPNFRDRHLIGGCEYVLATTKGLASLSAEDSGVWLKWLSRSQSISARSVPSSSWLKNCQAELGGVSAQSQLNFIRKVLRRITWPPCLDGKNAETIRAAIFGAVELEAADVCDLVAGFAEKYCFKTIPSVGISAERLGNACLWVLINRKQGDGIPHLVRLLVKIKYPKVKKKIAAALDEAAKARGKTRGALEEMSFRDFGLNAQDMRTIALAGGEATLELNHMGDVTLSWRGEGGRIAKSPPSSLKQEKEAIKHIRAVAKEIEAEVALHKLRIQKVWLEERSWTLPEWLSRYGNHPVAGVIARRLIWTATSERRAIDFSFVGGVAQDLCGDAITLDGSTITLWHPVLADVRQVLAWRKRLAALGVVQPFKQAHREIYLVTPAEMETNTYSNRFAGHILKQHQFMELARQSGWNVSHRISADVQNDQPAHIVLPAHGMVAEYWNSPGGGIEGEFNDAGAYLYLATDRLCFYRIAENASAVRSTAYGPTRGAAIVINNVPKLVLSEVMRHCDLFVGVASVANDPEWRDGGSNARHPNQWRDIVGNEYWNRQAFGKLDGSSETRREMLDMLLPALEIGKVACTDGRFLKVIGKLRSYKIHMGSGNVLMEPDDAYLCIVPQSVAAGDLDKTRLPFEGDRKLSIILSKALLLAADDKITDEGIKRQITRP